MRTMICKTLFAAILGSFLVGPIAHADRQGGGTLKVAAKAFDTQFSQWVLFKGIEGDQVTFDFTGFQGTDHAVGQSSLRKADLKLQEPGLVRALLESKSGSAWARLK